MNNPDKLRKIVTESKIHHARADSAYKALDKDGQTGEDNKDTVCLSGI